MGALVVMHHSSAGSRLCTVSSSTCWCWGAEEGGSHAYSCEQALCARCRPLRLPLGMSLKVRETVQPLAHGSTGRNNPHQCWSAGVVTPQVTSLPATQTHDLQQLQ